MLFRSILDALRAAHYAELGANIHRACADLEIALTHVAYAHRPRGLIGSFIDYLRPWQAVFGTTATPSVTTPVRHDFSSGVKPLRKTALVKGSIWPHRHLRSSKPKYLLGADLLWRFG